MPQGNYPETIRPLPGDSIDDMLMVLAGRIAYWTGERDDHDPEGWPWKAFDGVRQELQRLYDGLTKPVPGRLNPMYFYGMLVPVELPVTGVPGEKTTIIITARFFGQDGVLQHAARPTPGPHIVTWRVMGLQNTYGLEHIPMLTQANGGLGVRIAPPTVHPDLCLTVEDAIRESWWETDPLAHLRSRM